MKPGIFTCSGLMVLFCALSGCGTQAPDDPSELNTVATTYDVNYPFNSARTYAMPDTVVVVKDPSNPQVSQPVNTSLNDAVLSRVAENLKKAGFTRLTDTNGPKPDVYVEVGAMTVTATFSYYNYWYPTWGAYYAPWYGTSFGVGWAPYASTYVSSATVGSLVLNMTNPNAPNAAEEKIPTVWAAVIGGVMNPTNPGSNAQSVSTLIDQAFAQSPYL